MVIGNFDLHMVYMVKVRRVDYLPVYRYHALSGPNL